MFGLCGHRLVSLKRGPELFSEKFGLLAVEYSFKLSRGVLHYKLSIERLRFVDRERRICPCFLPSTSQNKDSRLKTAELLE